MIHFKMIEENRQRRVYSTRDEVPCPQDSYRIRIINGMHPLRRNSFHRNADCRNSIKFFSAIFRFDYQSFDNVPFDENIFDKLHVGDHLYHHYCLALLTKKLHFYRTYQFTYGIYCKCPKAVIAEKQIINIQYLSMKD